MLSEAALIDAIDGELVPLGFARREIAAVEGADHVVVWARKTWNTNRAVAVLRLAAGDHPGERAQALKIPLGKAIGYFPFFYGIGLQVVFVGADVVPVQGGLDGYVDKIDNQRSIVQSLFVIDLARRATEGARTWGQVVTGRFQDAIDRGIRNALALA